LAVVDRQRILGVVGRALRVVAVLLSVVARLLLALLIGLWSLAEWGWPRLERRTRKLRRRLRRRVRRAWRRARRTPVRTALAAALLGLLALNGTIRYVGGGNPSLLSTRDLGDKARAVMRLVLHLPFHPFGSCSAPRDELVAEAAGAHGVPAGLVEVVARTESAFRSHAISSAGAMGVMQLIPSTAELMKVTDPFDAKASLHGGARYLGQLWRRYDGDVERVAAAYHAGPGAVPRKGRLRVGPRTRRYMRLVARRYRRRAGR
jgi:hypothetical protein